MLYKSQVYTSASGSVDGLTYSRNRYGKYTRAKSMPVNPNSTRQAAARGRFANSIEGWTTLTAAQRTAWSTYADNVPGLNRVGDSVTLTGQNQYVRSAALRDQIGLAVIAPGPTVFNRGNPVTDFDTLAIDAGVFVVTFDIAGGASTDGDLAVFLGQNQNPSRSFYAGPYQFASATAVAAAATSQVVSITIATSGTEYLPVIGLNCPVKVVVVYDDGRVSDSFRIMDLAISGA